MSAVGLVYKPVDCSIVDVDIIRGKSKTSMRPNPGIIVNLGKSSPYGRKIQVSEILYFTQIIDSFTSYLR